MTALYRTVLIESAEQAEALPIGTVATHDKGSGMDHAHKLFPPLGHTESLLWASLTGLVSNAGMVGWTALVPIEAEEENAANRINITHMSPPAPQQVPVVLPCPRCGLR